MTRVMPRWQPLSPASRTSERTKLSWKLFPLFLIVLVSGYVSLLLRLPSSPPPEMVMTTESASHLESSVHGVEKHLENFKKPRRNKKKRSKDKIDKDDSKNSNLLVTENNKNSGTDSISIVNPPPPEDPPTDRTAEEQKNNMSNTTTLRPTNNNEINYWNLNHTAFYNIPSDGTNLWDDPSEAQRVPEWMKRYFNWHKHKRQTWSLETFHKERFLVMQCLGGQDGKCGGTADRLKPLPWVLRVAYYTHRILLIRWTKPAMLEEFLVPPERGFDWRVPDWLAEIMSNVTNGKRLVPNTIIRQYSEGNMTLIRSRYQSWNGGSDWYDAHLLEGPSEPNFSQVFSDVWKIFFTPSPAIENFIRQELNRLHLVPGKYVGAHLRALYAIKERDEKQIEDGARNAIHCASELRPGAPIFLASDSTHATEYAPNYVKAMPHAVPVAVRVPDPNPPLHLDRAKNWVNRPPSDYFDTFVDLYLLALAGCVTYNKGGFGHWGLLIGGNVTCVKVQDWTQKGVRKRCRWASGGDRPIHDERIVEPLFLRRMT